MESEEKNRGAKKAYVRPSPLSSYITLGGGIVFLFLGLFIMGEGTMGEGGDAVAMFRVIWVLACLAVIGYSVWNLRSFKGSSAEEKGFSTALDVIHIEEGSEKGGGEKTVDFDIRLRKLEALKSDGLISEEEYKRKREEILQEKW
jgi:hypothetical protein